MEEKSFRVLLDLSEMNIGENEIKYVWMFVSPRELKTIFDLKRAINKKMPLLQENYKLFLRDGLLLENEKISILREEDTIKLQSQYSFQECSFRSLDVINMNVHSGKSLSLDSCSSKKSKKRKSDVFVSSVKECSSIHKQKKKKQDKSPDKSSLDNKNDVDDISLNSMPNLSYVVFEPPKEKSQKNVLPCKKKIDNITNKEQLVKCGTKSKTFRNDNVPCAFTYSPEVEKSAATYESDLSFTNTNTQEANFENGFSQGEQKSKHGAKVETFKSSNVSYAVTQSLEIEKSDDVSEFKTNSHNVNLENESSHMEVNLKVHSPKQNEHKKRKRRRKRKRKETTVASESCVQVIDLESGISTQESEIVFNKTHNTPDKRKHIIYNSPISSPKRIETVTLDPCSITYSEVQDDSQSISKENVESESLSGLDLCVARFVEENKNLESIQESITEYQQNSFSGRSDNSLKISTPYPKRLKGQSWSITPLSRNSNTPSNTFIIEDCNTSKKEKATKSYTEYPSLNYLPPVGTRLAFKTLELNEKYCPEVTDYKEGIVKNIDLNIDELTIELVQEEVKPGRIGKFENLKEDEIPPNEIIKTVLLNWSALIDPRLIP